MTNGLQTRTASRIDKRKGGKWHNLEWKLSKYKFLKNNFLVLEKSIIIITKNDLGKIKVMCMYANFKTIFKNMNLSLMFNCKLEEIIVFHLPLNPRCLQHWVKRNLWTILLVNRFWYFLLTVVFILSLAASVASMLCGRGGGGAVATRIIRSANREYILLYRYIQRIYSIMDSGNKNTYW